MTKALFVAQTSGPISGIHSTECPWNIPRVNWLEIQPHCKTNPSPSARPCLPSFPFPLFIPSFPVFIPPWSSSLTLSSAPSPPNLSWKEKSTELFCYLGSPGVAVGDVKMPPLLCNNRALDVAWGLSTKRPQLRVIKGNEGKCWVTAARIWEVNTDYGS